LQSSFEGGRDEEVYAGLEVRGDGVGEGGGLFAAEGGEGGVGDGVVEVDVVFGLGVPGEVEAGGWGHGCGLGGRGEGGSRSGSG